MTTGATPRRSESQVRAPAGAHAGQVGSVGGNFLLNVGPTPEGEILPVHAERLREVGRWLAANGAAIYGTRAGVIPPTREMVSTRRGDTHYVHVLDDVATA